MLFETDKWLRMLLSIFWNFVVLFLFKFTAPYGCFLYRSIEYIQLPMYSDKYVTSGILWNVEVNSIYVCVISCYYDDGCVSFFYNNQSCNGYGRNIPISGDIIPSTGKVFYHQEGLPDESTTTENPTTLEDTTTEAPTTEMPTTLEDTTTKEVTTTPAAPWCVGDRFVEDTVSGICYKAWTTQETWSDAKTICEGEGGTLAILDTTDKINLTALIPDYQCSPGKLGPVVNICYWTTLATNTRNNSQTDCSVQGGMLASFPDNNTYNIIINGTGILDSSDTWWLGLNDMGTEGVMKTYDDQPMPWDNVVIPWGYFMKDCAIISPSDNFKWIEDDCSNFHKAVCEKQLVTDFWIGGSDQAIEGTWKWDDGGNVDMTSSKWHTSQPNGSTAEDCLVLKYDGNGTLFADEVCSIAKNFICEKTIT